MKWSQERETEREENFIIQQHFKQKEERFKQKLLENCRKWFDDPENKKFHIYASKNYKKFTLFCLTSYKNFWIRLKIIEIVRKTL